MNDLSPCQKLLYEHEVLWARYEIREHYLQHVVQDVYQSTGQVLSLVRVQLGLLSTGKVWSEEKITEPGKLVGKAIHDLRDMCRYFHPETELIDNCGFVETIEHELQRTGIGATSKPVKVKGAPGMLSTGTELIVFRMLQEILFSIKKHYKEGFTFNISYAKNAVSFRMGYIGNPILLHPSAAAGHLPASTRLSLTERAEVIGGKLQLKNGKDNAVHLKLTVPFKTT